MILPGHTVNCEKVAENQATVVAVFLPSNVYSMILYWNDSLPACAHGAGSPQRERPAPEPAQHSRCRYCGSPRCRRGACPTGG